MHYSKYTIMPRIQDDSTEGDSDSDSNTHPPILTDGGKGDDSLTRSSQRLGDRFSRGESADEESTEDAASTHQNSRTNDGATSEATDDAEGETEPESEPEPEWNPATIYLTEDTRKEFNRFLMRIQLNYREIEEVNKRDIHEGVILAAMEHPEEVAAIVEQNTSP